MAEIRTTSSTGGQKGVKLARFDLIPPGPLKELAEHYGRGARKYANHQWRQGYEWSKSIAALARHFNDFIAGKDYDVCSNDPDGCSTVDQDGMPFDSGEPDTCFNHTGSHHMAAVAWHSFLLLEFKDVHPDHDDRYRPEPDGEFPDGWQDLGWIEEDGITLTVEASEISPETVALLTGSYSFPVRFVAGVDHTVDRFPPFEPVDLSPFLVEMQDAVNLMADMYPTHELNEYHNRG